MERVAAWKYLKATGASLMGVGYNTWDDVMRCHVVIVDGIRASYPGGPYRIFNEGDDDYNDDELDAFVRECEKIKSEKRRTRK